MLAKLARIAFIELRWPKERSPRELKKPVDLGLIPRRVKPTTLILVFAASLPDAQAIKEQCVKQAGKFTCCAVGNKTSRDSPILV